MTTALTTYLDQLRAVVAGAEAPGEVPELARVSGARDDHLGIAICSIEGEVTAVGSDHAFPIQSISKAFAYGAVIDLHGLDHVTDLIDEEPTGEEFSAISLDPGSGRPKNPLVNIGAIRTHALLGSSREERVARLRAVLGGAAGRELTPHRQTLDEELTTADRNLALAYMLRAAGAMQEEAHEVVAGYLEGCATLTSVTDLAVMAATLASGGANPLTGEQVFSRVAARQVLAVMITSGMYDSAGDWVSDVGLPAKSGVAGGILAALPSRFGVSTYAPALDDHGNSARGILAFERIAQVFDLHLLDGVEPRDLEQRAAELVRDGGSP